MNKFMNLSLNVTRGIWSHVFVIWVFDGFSLHLLVMVWKDSWLMYH